MTKRAIGLSLLLTIVGLGVSCATAPQSEKEKGYERSDRKAESQFAIILEGFRFPEKLDEDKANFRFIVGLRFFDKDDNFNTVHTIMPGLDTFWECDTDKKENPNYVRGPVEDGYVNFNMDAVGKWDSLIFVVKGVRLHSIQFKVFDVNREDVWDELSGLIKGLFAMGVGVATANIPSAFAPPVQGLTDDLRLAVMNKITSDDELLFRKSRSFDENNFVVGEPAKYVLSYNGTEHDYKIKFTVTRKEVFN